MSESEKPLVAIRCIAYNQGAYIREALEGFVSQKTDFKYVVVVHDDASTDSTPIVIKEFADRYPDLILPIFETENQYSKPGNPLGKIMAEAIEETGAKYMAFCEGDDYWTDPYKLQKQVDFLELHPDYGMCYSKADRFDQASGKILNSWGGPNTTFESLLLKNTIPTLTALVRIDLFSDFNSEIQPDLRDWKMGDYPLWLYISLKAKIHFSPEVTAVYRVLGESASHSKSISKRYYFDKNYKEIAEFFLNLNIDKVSTEVKDKFYISKHSLLLTMANIVRDNEELVQAKEFLQTRVKTLRLRILTLPNWLIRFPLMLKFRLEGWTL